MLKKLSTLFWSYYQIILYEIQQRILSNKFIVTLFLMYINKAVENSKNTCKKEDFFATKFSHEAHLFQYHEKVRGNNRKLLLSNEKLIA